MYEKEKQFTRLTVENNDVKVVYELPHNEASGDDMMEAIATLMVGMTFPISVVYHAMADYLREHAYDEYDVYDHDKSEDKPDE